MIKKLLLASAVATTALGTINVHATDLDWHYGAEPQSYCSFGASTKYTDYGFIYIDGETATKLAGNKINGFKVINGHYGAPIAKVTYIFTESLSADPYFSRTESVKSTELDETSSYVETWNSNSFTFTEPYTIKAGQGFYVGLSFNEKSSANYPFAIDNLSTTNYKGGFMGAHVANGTQMKDVQLEDLTSQYGALGVVLNISGDNLPQQDVCALNLSKEVNRVNPGDKYTCTVPIVNRGTTPVSSVDYRYKINDGAWQTDKYTFSEPLDFGKYYTLPITFAQPNIEGIVHETFEITAVNGANDENTDDNTVSDVTLSFSESSTSAFKRNVFGEEFTGTWCRFCPRGYVGMEYMKSTYTDGSWIGVAVHSGDEMYTSDYYDVLSEYITGLPSAMVDRVEVIDPEQSELETNYKKELAKAAPAKISLTASHDDENVYVTSNVTFAFDIEPNFFQIEYILREDNVGPYDQKNEYSGVSYEMGGFENMTNPVSLMYNDVARARVIYDNPFENGAAANTAVTHQGSIAIPEGVNIDNTNVIAVVSTLGNYICNAQIATEYGAAVNDIVADDANNFAPTVNNGTLSVGNVDAEVYTITGQRVASLRNNNSVNLAAGLYIVRTGNKAQKVLVK